jgi:hypothetical protein
MESIAARQVTLRFCNPVLNAVQVAPRSADRHTPAPLTPPNRIVPEAAKEFTRLKEWLEK